MLYYSSFVTRKNALGALLDVYQKTIQELILTLQEVSSEDLLVIVDRDTDDEDCRSIQTLLTHVVNSGFGYADYIRAHHQVETISLGKVYHEEVMNYIEELENVFQFTVATFTDEAIVHATIEEKSDAQKMLVRWGQKYDIEQLLEHAIVHVMRHHRQIEKFLNSIHRLPKI